MTLLVVFVERSNGLPPNFKLSKLLLLFLTIIIFALHPSSTHNSQILRLLYLILNSLPIFITTSHRRLVIKAVQLDITILGIPLQTCRWVAAQGVAVFGHKLILLYKLLFNGWKTVMGVFFGLLLVIGQSRL